MHYIFIFPVPKVELERQAEGNNENRKQFFRIFFFTEFTEQRGSVSSKNRSGYLPFIIFSSHYT